MLSVAQKLVIQKTVRHSVTTVGHTDIKVSLFASSKRPALYDAFIKSLQGTSVEFEVVFAGPCDVNYPGIKYIKTEDIKPAQCYEVARRECIGEVVVWVADDCEFPNDVIGKAYNYWKSKGNEKLILSIQTKESGYGLPIGRLFDMDNHRFFGGDKTSPLMAPLGMMSRKFLDDLGGIDSRYICGQYENDIVMRTYNAGGDVEIFGGPDCFIDIDHLGKSIAIGESRDERSFQRRPFATGYLIDRKILETSWTNGGRFIKDNHKFLRNDDLVMYGKDILSYSTKPRLGWV